MHVTLGVTWISIQAEKSLVMLSFWSKQLIVAKASQLQLSCDSFSITSIDFDPVFNHSLVPANKV